TVRLPTVVCRPTSVQLYIFNPRWFSTTSCRSPVRTKRGRSNTTSDGNSKYSAILARKRSFFGLSMFTIPSPLLLPNYALTDEKMSGIRNGADHGASGNRLMCRPPLLKIFQDQLFPVPGRVLRHPMKDVIQHRPHLWTGGQAQKGHHVVAGHGQILPRKNRLVGEQRLDSPVEPG